MAERELANLQRQCGRQRLSEQATMDHAVTARTARRNGAIAAITWPCTTADARVKLRRLYPAFEP